MSDRWLEYIRGSSAPDQGWLAKAVAHWQFNQPLYGHICSLVQPGARILDVGCGHGFSDLFLAASGYQVTGVDNDERIVAIAEQFATQTNSPALFERADAFDLSIYHGKFDLAYSCGVLEHFDRNVTIRLLQEQARCATYVLIEIPSKYTSYTGTITDERIYTMRQLRQLVVDAGLSISASFGYGDICSTTAQGWLRRLLPQGVYRWLQNHGYAFAMCVVGSQAGK